MKNKLTDMQIKDILHVRIAVRFNGAMRTHKAIKFGKHLDLLGCSLSEYKKYLESLFKPGMTWENCGKFGWHIDHINSVSEFNLTNIEEQKECFNYKNTQPLWAGEHYAKDRKPPKDILLIYQVTDIKITEKKNICVTFHDVDNLSYDELFMYIGRFIIFENNRYIVSTVVHDCYEKRKPCVYQGKKKIV